MVPTFLLDAFRAVLAAVVSVAIATPSSPFPPTRPLGEGPVVGADLSWPNCPLGMGMPARKTLGKPLPRASARFVVIGLTNGPAFHPNPCLVSQVAFARERHLYAAAYAVATYPTTAQLRRYGAAGPHTHAHRHGRLWNTGYAQARVNVDALADVGLHSPMIWVDVETVSRPAPWSPFHGRNATVLDGVLRGYQDAGLRVGFYSTPRLWRSIVGPTRYGLPEWRTAGPTSREVALDRCTSGSFQGGQAVLAQWWDDDRDHDLLCPGPAPHDVLPAYFVRL